MEQESEGEMERGGAIGLDLAGLLGSRVGVFMRMDEWR